MKTLYLILLSLCINSFAQSYDWPSEKAFHSESAKTLEDSIKLIRIFPEWHKENLDKIGLKENKKYLYMFRRAIGYLRFNPDYNMTEEEREKFIEIALTFQDDEPISLLRILGAADKAERRIEELLQNGKYSKTTAFRKRAMHKKYTLSPEMYLNYLVDQVNNPNLEKFIYETSFAAIEQAIAINKFDIAVKVFNTLEIHPQFTNKQQYSLLYNKARIYHLQGKIVDARKVMKALLRKLNGKDFTHQFGFYSSSSFGSKAIAFNNYLNLLPEDYNTPSGSWSFPNNNSSAFNFTGKSASLELKPNVRKEFINVYKVIYRWRQFTDDHRRGLYLDDIINEDKENIVEEMVKVLKGDPNFVERRIAFEVINRVSNKENADVIIKYFHEEQKLFPYAFKADPVRALEVFIKKVHSCAGSAHLQPYSWDKIINDKIESAYPVLFYLCAAGNNGYTEVSRNLAKNLNSQSSVKSKKIIQLSTLAALRTAENKASKYSSLKKHIQEQAEAAFSCGNIEGLKALLKLSTVKEKQVLEFYNSIAEDSKKVISLKQLKTILPDLKWSDQKLKWQ